MVDMNKAPKPRGGVRFEELDGEAVLYDRTGKRATYLNETATVVWRLCDGTRTVGEIVALLKKEYPQAAGQIEADVGETIDRLIAERTLVFASPANARVAEAQAS